MATTATAKHANLTYAWERATNAKGKGGGSADRKQKQHYATLVTVALTGTPLWQDESGAWSAICPLTGLAFALEFGEVDEVDPTRGYHPGLIVMVSKRGNQERRTLQQHGLDLPGIARYAADVAKASDGIAIPRKSISVPLVTSWGRTMNGDAIGNGPYGIA